MNSEVLYNGGPFGGCSVLFNSALSHCIDFIVLNCKRLCLPCDTNNDSYDYNEVLSTISHYCCNKQVIHCIIVGDLNTDFTGLWSNNTISLKLFLEEEDMTCVLDLLSNDVLHSYL